MDGIINRNNSIAEENIDPNGRPATEKFREWKNIVSDRTENVFHDTKDDAIEDREKRIKEMEEIIKKDLE